MHPGIFNASRATVHLEEDIQQELTAVQRQAKNQKMQQGEHLRLIMRLCFIQDLPLHRVKQIQETSIPSEVQWRETTATRETIQNL